jgi:hypothetical protein
MAKSRQSLVVRVSRVTGGRHKKPTSRVERAFEDLKRLVSDTAATAADRKRTGRQRQAETKQAGATRIRSGRQRQATVKKAARKRGARTS